MSNSLSKKLLLAILFLIIFAAFNFKLNGFLNNPDVIFSLSLNNFIQLIILVGLLLLSSLSYVLFTSFTANWGVIAIIGIVAASLPVIFLSAVSVSYLAGVGFLVMFAVVSFYLNRILKNYINFSAIDLFSTPTKNLAKLLILVIAISYFLSVRAHLQVNGFQIPDVLIDTALKFTPQEANSGLSQQNLSQEQISLLRSNPDVLRQYGVDPKVLDSLENNLGTPPQNLIKNTVKQQLQEIISPYQAIIPAIMAVLIFFTLISFLSVLGLLIAPLLWLIFYIFEKTGFIEFTKEMREVKKMVV